MKGLGFWFQELIQVRMSFSRRARICGLRAVSACSSGLRTNPRRGPGGGEVHVEPGMIRTCVPADPQSKGGSEATVRIAKRDLVRRPPECGHGDSCCERESAFSLVLLFELDG